ncbi:hypothetical protein ADUPG1_008981 [Aduncisulcus paluster]|uniref:Uncharacterized protein n=1 Tax=Aduncisulcus paluster TaxID=2918883 RepID=A0ABQ5KWS8_9EUKA|nr:hypothetical protein ADUPG1_008981 [Aduncisulcus paluster]|eukprot:gnl/Carplike_NY0171/577_a785_2538.p1 GENE.gnl/Carplike_NY0171/577_a785_2538~~gnl/Carplike_NY0171/577_a785_2538.p1  ORF type:complete len:338 (+),score=130.77 gnl/Carplike_NY0171/577_a785_2538:108-1121(+)
MPAHPIEVLLLCALPASGKSETRKFLKSLTPEENLVKFRIGDTSTQCDDYPYVHMMRQIDDALESFSAPRFFFEAADKGFKESADWGTLIEMVNEDFADLYSVAKKPEIKSAAEWLLNRYDAARTKVGVKSLFAGLDSEVVAKLSALIEEECRGIFDEKYDAIPESLEGKTVVIEFARGGPHGSTFPLPEPFGYQYSFSRLSPLILERAAILYVWVTPEQSRAKNVARAMEKAGDPTTVALSLNHGVPHAVMMGDYGCDDMVYLESVSGKPSTIKITCAADKKDYFMPIGKFDNRDDKTTFARGPKAEWKTEDVAAISKGLEDAFKGLVEQYDAMKK